MANESKMASTAETEPTIYLLRRQRVMLDADLAGVYGVSTKRLNEQFKRNRHRFPPDFAFILTREELAALRSQFATSKGRGGARYLPVAFTEHGAIMLAAVLNSARAVEMSVFVVRAFVRMRELLADNRELASRLDELERRVGVHDGAIAELFEAIRQLLEPPVEEKRTEIGFHIREVAPPYRIRPKKRF